MKENTRDSHLIQNQQESTNIMKLDLKTVFVAVAIIISHQYINSHKESQINQMVSNLSEPNIKVISLTN